MKKQIRAIAAVAAATMLLTGCAAQAEQHFRTDTYDTDPKQHRFVC